MLDILLIPGPNPSTIFEPKVLDFVRGHAHWQGGDGKSTDVLSICTGCIVLGQSGILKGKKASGPRGIMSKLRKDFPDTTWVEDRRWVKDGNIWTSGKQTPSLARNIRLQEITRANLWQVESQMVRIW
jgi:putative intracellular protease/amidase